MNDEPKKPAHKRFLPNGEPSLPSPLWSGANPDQRYDHLSEQLEELDESSLVPAPEDNQPSPT